MLAIFREMMRDSSGQGLLEYALIIGIVSIAAVAGLTALSQKTNNTLLSPSASAIPG